MKYFYLLAILFLTCSYATMPYDCMRFVEEGVIQDPILEETKYSIESKKAASDALFASVILPKFTFSMLVGPAPGLKESVDDWGDTVDAWDFTKMGPFFGAEIQAVQPLNIGQYKVGQKAIKADIKQEEMNILNKELKKEVELQTYYYNYLLASDMLELALDAKKQIDKAYTQLEEKLDEDDESVSQMDLLELKSKMHIVKEGVSEATSGLNQVMLAIRFSLGLAENDSFQTTEENLTIRKEPLPPLEEVEILTLKFHPDLKRLDFGLEAKAYQVDLAKSKLAPEFFIMGEFTYAKSWAGDRTSIQKNAFAQDAVNHISGSIGIGFRYRLNFWNGLENLRKAKIEYRSLKLKEQYAAEGTVLKAKEQYYKALAAKEKADALKESLKASESILKGAAMQYDLDKSNTSALVSAYTQNINLKKDYAYAVCKYNILLAELIARMGMHLRDYRNHFNIQ